MDNKDIFTVMITKSDDNVQEIASDCVLVLAHNIQSEDESDFNMLLNSSTSGKTMFMLLQAIDQAKQQILDSDEELKRIYLTSQVLRKGDDDA